LNKVQADSHRRQSWGLGGRDPPDFWAGGRNGDRGRVVKYYCILSYRRYVQKW